MHKKIQLTTLLVMIMSLVWGSAAAQFAGGSGTIIDPYQISTPEQLDSVRNYLSSHFELINDINLDIAPYNTGSGWVPLGTSSVNFSGSFDGQGYTISNLFIDNISVSYASLFGLVSTQFFIKDLELDGIDVRGGAFVAGLSSDIRGGNIDNIHINGTIEATGAYAGMLTAITRFFNVTISNSSSIGTISGISRIGGLVGEAQDTTLISNSSSSASVEATQLWGGGLIGVTSSITDVINSSASGSVLSGNNSGGLVGYNQGEIRRSSASGNVTSTEYYIGGLVGRNNGQIIESFATGDVTSTSYGIGGLVGISSGNIFNSYATGSVEGSDEVGGLVGYQTSFNIINSYSIGEVIGSSFNTNALVGELHLNATVFDSYWNSETVGSNGTGPGNGLSSNQMRQQATFNNWDFTNVWTIDENYSFPYLQLNSPTDIPGFIEPPTAISQVFPEAAASGSKANIYGTNFSTTTTDQSVLIGGVSANVLEAYEKYLVVEVPELTPGLHTVSVTKDGVTDELINAFQFLIPSAANFESEQFLFSMNDIINLNAGDFNNNGDIDLVMNSGGLNDVNIRYNNQNFQFTSITNIHSTFENHDAHPVDIDDDGDLDVIASLITQNTPTNSNDDRITWFRNNGPTNNPTYTEITISATIHGIRDIFPADLDGDGDEDVIVTELGGGNVIWFRNNDGNFGAAEVVTTNAPGASCVHAADLNNDGLMDVLSGTGSGQVVSWYPNAGNGSFPQKIDIISGESNVCEIKAADFDNDGHLDILAHGNNTVDWFRNDGAADFSDRRTIDSNFFQPSDYLPADLDGDGDQDVLVSSFDNGKLAWFQNYGDGRFSSANEFPASIDRAQSIDAADYDNDGDIDVIFGQRFASDGPGAYLFENTSITNSPIADYPFDGDMLDNSGNAYNLIPNGDVFLTTDRGGAIDSAYFFDGDLDYFNTVPTQPFDLETFTYSTWINPYNLPENGTLGVFLAKQTPNVQTGLLMYFFPDGRLSTTIYDANGNYNRPSGYTANIGEWIHYAATYDGNRLQTYINGQAEAGQDFGITPIYDSASLTVGGYNRLNNTFNGKMEEVLVYGQALTASEIEAIYNAQVPEMFDNTSQWTSIISTSLNGKNSSAEFGTTPSSTDGFDPAIDIPLPPTPTGDYVQLFFAHPEFGGLLGDNYRSDYKAYSDYGTSNSSWLLSMYSTIAGSDTLFFSRPVGFTAPIKVIDQNGTEYISLSGDLEVMYSIQAGETLTFDIVVGDITPPEITLGTIMDGPQIWDKTIARTLDWSVEDPSGISNIVVEVSYDGGATWTNVYTGLDETTSFTPDQAIEINESTFFRVTATDGASQNFSNTTTEQGNDEISIIAPTQTFSYLEGWQMVGSPFENEISVSSVISDAIRYRWNTPTFEYLLTDSYPSREGIWLGAYEDGTDELVGDVGESTTDITVKAGWNMATSPLFRDVSVDSITVFDGTTQLTYADAVSGFLITSPQGYNGAGYEVTQSLDFFSSYWIGVTVDSLVLTLPIHRFAPSLKQVNDVNEHNLVLTLSDGVQEQELLVRVGGDPSQPAPPPAPNAYRVGFIGESTVLGNLYTQFSLSQEDLNGVEIPLLMDGPERPVTLSWSISGFDGTPVSLKSESNIPLEDTGALEFSSSDINSLKLAFGEFAVNLEEKNAIPSKFSLAQNYPNPFNPSTSISFALPQNERVILEVFSITGQKVGMLVNETLSAGNHTIQFNASGLSSGTYIYRIQAGEFVEIRKMVLVK